MRLNYIQMTADVRSGKRLTLKCTALVPRSRRQWLAIGSIPSRELFECLVLVAGEELGGGTEVGDAGGGQSHRGLHPGPGQLGSSEEAGRSDGAGRHAEDREGRHFERRTTLNRTGTMVRGEIWMETGRGGEKCS
jgi:hypothetical protein